MAMTNWSGIRPQDAYRTLDERIDRMQAMITELRLEMERLIAEVHDSANASAVEEVAEALSPRPRRARKKQEEVADG